MFLDSLLILDLVQQCCYNSALSPKAGWIKAFSSSWSDCDTFQSLSGVTLTSISPRGPFSLPASSPPAACVSYPVWPRPRRPGWPPASPTPRSTGCRCSRRRGRWGLPAHCAPSGTPWPAPAGSRRWPAGRPGAPWTPSCWGARRCRPACPWGRSPAPGRTEEEPDYLIGCCRWC